VLAQVVGMEDFLLKQAGGGGVSTGHFVGERWKGLNCKTNFSKKVKQKSTKVVAKVEKS
jgi:hypothetical protein